MQALIKNFNPGPASAACNALLSLICASCLTSLTLDAAQAQSVFRIVGPDGQVTFSDKPPTTPASKSTLLETGAKDTGSSGATLPYELRQVVNKYPVTLYTTKNCAPCESGRQLLLMRGVPFTEKTVTTAEDSDELQRLSGSRTLPFLTLGVQQFKGYSDAEWTHYFSAAGYPETSQLPARYTNSAATALVKLKTPATPAPSSNTGADAAPKSNPDPAPVPRVTPANPAGIEF